MIPSITSSGLAAIQSGFGRLADAATRLQNATRPADENAPPVEDDIVDAAVELGQGKREVEIGAAVLRRANDATKSLLDLFA